MKLDKLTLFKEIVETQDIKPTSPLFKEAVKNELLKSVSVEVPLDFASPLTLGQVDQAAKNFKYAMKTLWTG